MKTVYFFLLFSLPLLTADLFAQNETVRQLISLEGIQEVGFTANLEGSRTVTSDKNLTPSNIR